MKRSIIKMQDVTYKNIFHNFNLEINRGSFTTIIGKNGSGKTTIFKIILGLLPFEGYINIDGYLLNDFFMKKIRRSFGFASLNTSNYLLGETLKDNLIFILENLGYSHREIDNKINDLSKKFKLDDILDNSIENISLSDKSKFQVAASLIHNPKILLLDNTLSNLDSVNKKLILKALKEYQKKDNLTIILITNDLEDTLISDKIILLDKGKILLEGSKEELYQDDKLEKLGFNLPFIVKLSHNLILYNILDKVYFNDKEVIDKLWP